MKCDSCGHEDIHYNLAAEYQKDGQWTRGVVCFECQKRLAPAIREKNARHDAPRPAAEPTPQLAAGGHFLLK